MGTIQAPPSGSFFFFDHCPDSLQCGLWRSDGTPAGTGVLKGAGGLSFGGAHSFVVRGDRLFFLAGPGVSDFGLWSTDGTPEGTRMVADIAPGGLSALPYYYFPGNTTVSNGFLFFNADDGTTGPEPWALRLEP